MIEKIISACAHNRFLVVTFVALATLAGVLCMGKIPLDAIPDISDVQVIVYTPWEGRSPDLIEDQVTYPIVSTLVSAPKVKTVRGLSDFGFSYVYAIFEDGTDIYWARSRVLEYLQQLYGKLPQGAAPMLGPDASGVGWVYTYALVDDSGQHDLAQLRSLQDWYLRYALSSVPGVSEVASIGGYVKQYQIQVDPNRLAAYGISIRDVMDQIRMSNNDVEGRLIEFSGREYMVRGLGYLKSVEDIRAIVVGSNSGTPVLMKDIAHVGLGPDIRRGIVELDGIGEVAGGVVVIRYGENALTVIDAVKSKIAQITPGLPQGVRIVPTYDRSELIRQSIDNLQKTLLEEVIVVSVVIVVFLLHFKSALVPIIVLPIALIISFIPMYFFRVNANIMSLGGLALSIGVLVDASIVMVENGYRRLSEGSEQERINRFETLVNACRQVGRGIFFALVIIIVSFVPVFMLEAQEGRLFRPLAMTKTFAMAASSLLAITLVPVLMTLFLRGKRLRPESDNPLSRLIFMAGSLGSEFMPPLYEGTIFYMPVTMPGISLTEAQNLLAAQDRVLKGFPEVETVYGKAGRAETATDPAPLSMMETTVQLKPKSQWRKVIKEYAYLPQWMRPLARRVAGAERPLRYEELIEEMDRKMQFPGVQNAWTMPIRARIDMLSTGIRTPVGIKIFGADLDTIQELGLQAEAILKQVPGTRSVYAERVSGGYFVDILINRPAIARYGLTIEQVQEVIQTAVGGMNITRTVEGRERYPVNLRYPRELRDDIDKLGRILVPVRLRAGSEAMGSRNGDPSGLAQIPLAQLADIRLSAGPAMIRDEDALLAGYVFIDVTGRDLGGYVQEAKQTISEKLNLPPGYFLTWSGQYEFQERARQRLKIVLPIVFCVIFVLLYMTFRSISESIILMLAVLYAMTGGVILQFILGYNFSVAVWVGYIALYGIAVETGVVMIIYLNEALDKRIQQGTMSPNDIQAAAIEGSVLRLRPKIMTVATTLIALIPIMWSSGVGADVMKPIAAPIIGGLITSTIHVLIITPVIFAMLKARELRKGKLQASAMTH